LRPPLGDHFVARLLPPDPKALGEKTPMIDRDHKVSLATDMAVDQAMGGEEQLRLGCELEPLHLPFPSSFRPVRVQTTIV
jgi:hypothetical protein